MEILRLKKENYDELIELLNLVFTRKNGREMDFEKELPKMCVRNDERMGRHFGIFEDGKLVAALGVYPLPVDIAGERLLFSTVGNIATHPDYEGRGYMNLLIGRAMQELVELDVDASRLGGLRQRYNRFGYETCGRVYTFSLSDYNVKRKLLEKVQGVEFTRISREDISTLRLAKALQSANGIAVERSSDNAYADVYASMVAWKNIPWLAKKDGRAIGYLCASENGRSVAENYAYDTECMQTMLGAWQQRAGETIGFRFQPYETANIRAFSAICENVNIVAPCHFKIVKWERVIGAFMRLKATYTIMLKGEFTIEIEGYGGLRLYVNERGIGCEKYAGECEIKLDPLAASRYLFGILPPDCTGEANALVANWLPLPLSWNLQDRV